MQVARRSSGQVQEFTVWKLKTRKRYKKEQTEWTLDSELEEDSLQGADV